MSEQREDSARCDIDCEAGRRMGCGTFCCRLLVRLEPDEREYYYGKGTRKGYMDKDPDGWCVHHDRGTGLCRIWPERPRVCRAYGCNADPLLQVVLRHGCTSIAEVARLASALLIPLETYRRIPCLGDDASAEDADAAA